MKLIIAVVRDEYAGALSDNLTRGGFGVTKLASTGGFLKAGNSTFLIGVEREKVEEVLEIIRRSCPAPKRAGRGPSPSRPEAGTAAPEAIRALSGEITVGGATVFVLGVDRWLKV